MENIFFGILVAAVVVGLALACGTLLQIKRHGGFERAIALTPEGKWPFARGRTQRPFVCFGVALAIT